MVSLPMAFMHGQCSYWSNMYVLHTVYFIKLNYICIFSIYIFIYICNIPQLISYIFVLYTVVPKKVSVHRAVNKKNVLIVGIQCIVAGVVNIITAGNLSGSTLQYSFISQLSSEIRKTCVSLGRTAI